MQTTDTGMTITPLGGGESYAWPRAEMPAPGAQELFCQQDTGYRGIWHGQTAIPGEYAYKYSGGLGTYCAKHRSLAFYCEQVRKTFFCYGGTSPEGHELDMRVNERGDMAACKFEGPRQLWHMVGCYDHVTGKVSRPTILLDKWCGDPHDNPVLSVDEAGHIWVFSPSHGPWTSPSFIHRSVKPYDITRFETVATTLFAYPQPWPIPGKGFVLVHTQYENGRRMLASSRSADGRTWTTPKFHARIRNGQYQISNCRDGRIVTAFNYHPEEGGVERRTNLYVLQSTDLGETWTTLDGRAVELPLTEPKNPALVYDAESEGRLVYLKDIVFDHDGHPVVLTVTSGGHIPGPENDPRVWTLHRFDGSSWRRSEITRSDSNYDMGSLYIEDESTWRLIAPTEAGPQPYNPGGEMAMWLSDDAGETWRKRRDLTADSERNHTYARRPVNAHPDFYAFWADGHGREPSISRLYFCTRDGETFRLPLGMTGDWEAPERI